jgi:hypothetical protein
MKKKQKQTGDFERLNFKSLILTNPNYFGTFKGTGFKLIKAMSTNTSYEELMCLGFHPQLSQLEGVVYVKKNSGYSGGLCSGGSTEYVRFYLSFDGGASWQDQGMAQFSAYDMPGTKPLEYAVSMPVNPRRRFCWTENLIKARAILSWNEPPTANDPGYTPVWGNVVDVDIQVAPRKFFFLNELLEETKLKLPDNFILPVESEFPIPIPEPEPIQIGELHKMYKAGKDVPQHRYLYKALQMQTNVSLASHVSGKGGSGMPISGDLPKPIHPLGNMFAELKIDVASILEALFQTDGNTTYEELTCVGFDTINEALVGVINVKKSSGYSGGMCSSGSREYVAFWVDWGDGAGWTHEGTTSVRVHDIGSLPAKGLKYAVFEAVGLAGRRRRCSTAVTAKVRAILSWQVPPPSNNPDYVPTWGNREETTIHIPPGAYEDYKPILESISRVPVCGIDQSTGMTPLPWDQPFGGVLEITGFIPNAPDISTPDVDKLRYRVQIREVPPLPALPGPWQTVDNTFGISVIERIGAALPIQYGIDQEIQPDGYYIYREDMNVSGLGWRLVQNRVLAQWITAKPMTGVYEIKVNAKDPTTGILYAAQTLLCTDGTTRTTVKVKLDEIAPSCLVQITGFSTTEAGPVSPITGCATLKSGHWIHGIYEVADEHFGSLYLDVQPQGAPGANGATPNPSSKAYPVVPTLGENGTWKLDTTPMDACGYVIRLRVWDRTIVSSNGGWYCEDFEGFCLKK